MKFFTPAQLIFLLLIAAVALVGHAVNAHRRTGTAAPSDRPAQTLHLPNPDLRQRLLLGIPVSINEIGAEDLRLIPGISTRLAKRIIDYRRDHGPFETWHRLQSVHGIGPKTLEKLRPYVRIEGLRN
jgi:competence ComEA-like helix-hairpin-helix protein